MEFSQFVAQGLGVMILSGLLAWLVNHPKMFPEVECVPEADEDAS